MNPNKDNTNEKNWLTANENHLAGLYSISQCMCLADVTGEDENCLVVADLTNHRNQNKQMKLKVYKGLDLIKETNIIDLPTGVVSFFLDTNDPRTPAIAVASGPYVYIYKNMKPYYKFTLPLLDVDEDENRLWKSYNEGEMTCSDLRQNLENLRNGGTYLTVRSIKLIGTSSDKIEDFCQLYGPSHLKRQTIATCLTTLKKSHVEVDAISCLVVGTEAGQILVIDPEAFTVLSVVTIDSTPVFMTTIGLYEVEYRIYIACRNGCIYLIKRGSEGFRKLVYLNTQPVGMIRIGKPLMVGCMDDTLRCISPRGKEVWKKQLSNTIISMCHFESDQHNISGILVSMNNGIVELYNDKTLLERISVSDDVVTGLLFGAFGREQFALLLVTRGGSLIIKLLKRTAKLEAIDKDSSSNSDTKLAIPKKTKLFMDQAFNERENAVEVHRKFMQDLLNLRLVSARNYLDLLQTKETPISSKKTGAEAVMLGIEVHGVGPVFRMTLELKNTSASEAITGLQVVFICDPQIYSVEKPVVMVPFLVPGISYPYSVFVECINDKGISDTIKVVVFKQGETEPMVTGVVNMPVSETVFSS